MKTEDLQWNLRVEQKLQYELMKKRVDRMNPFFGIMRGLKRSNPF